MTTDQIKARIEILTAQSKQLELNLHAIGGAIQDCNYWLKLLEDEDAANQASLDVLQSEA
jgi:hypothetical protein